MFDVKIRCGEVYSFNLIESITDNHNGTIKIVGNFKPRGRNKHVVLWKMSITNFEELRNAFEIKLKPYFCLNCKKTHRSGKDFEPHIKYIGKKKDLIPCDRIIKADITKLRGIGKRQVESLLKIMKLNPLKSDRSRFQINKLFIYEGVALEELIPKSEL